MKTTVIHHSADFDGLFCREIAKMFLPQANLIGWNYGDPLIPVPEGRVYILDLSPSCLNFEGQLDRDKIPDWLIWIDHHKSSIADYSEEITGYRIDGVAACRLTLQWFHYLHHNAKNAHNPRFWVDLPQKQDYIDRIVSEPWAVRLAGEYDIWDKRDPHAELFQHGLKSEELTEAVWKCLLNMYGDETVERLLTQGKYIAHFRAQEYKDVITSQGFDLKFAGYTLLACCSHECDIRSHLFAAGLQPHHQGMIGFTFLGNKWRFSIYGRPEFPDIDFSILAKDYNGGGHKHSCGFITDGRVGMEIISGLR